MGAPDPIRVLLIDDHRLVHDAVDLAFSVAEDIVLLAHGNNGREAVQLCDEYKPDIILMDVVMPILNGIEATQIIHQRYPAVKILVLSSFQDDESVRTMLQNGAVGYVLKGSIASDLVDTIRITHSGKAVFSSEVTSVLLSTPSPQSQNFGLTERELEVLRLMAQGLNSGEIATRLTVSQSTVKFHINNLIRKFGVETRSEAIVIAAKHNLV